MVDYREGIKKDVVEIKFLIHDLRVERFINEIIHYHVTLDTDLEIYNVDQAQALHGEDLQELKRKAISQRKALQEYSTAVKSFSPDKTILAAGCKYVRTIYDICELILNPLWGRVDKVLGFLPEDSRSVRSRNHYRNSIRWISGVRFRIQHYLRETEGEDVTEEFDVAAEIEDFTRHVVYGYVQEKSGARVELQLDQLDSAVIRGNRYRLRRMFFNLVMNSVDAMSQRKVGVLSISVTVEEDRAVLRVRDNGSGMPPEKIKQLLTDRDSLDGELHSLGFVFVRQTIAQFGGEISLESEVDKGTKISVRFPFLQGVEPPPRPSVWEESESLREGDRVSKRARRADSADAKEAAPRPPQTDAEQEKSCGTLILDDYNSSDAQFPGCIFSIAVTEEDRVEFFTHRPYERYFNISHEDLSPMFFEATLRGRLEEDEEKNPVLILKAPQNVRDYFDFKEVPEDARNSERHVQMVRDEYVRVARTLLRTGLSAGLGVHLTDAQKFFPENDALNDDDARPLEVLAQQKLSHERED